MWRIIGRHIGQIIIVLVGISFITFALVTLAPGDTAKLMIVGNQDIVVSQEEIEAVRHEYGLDQPFMVQYGNWLVKAVQGDLGYSYMSKMPVTKKIFASLPATILLACTSIIMMLVVSIPAGIYAAVKSDKWADYIIRITTFWGVSIPNFWLGLILLWIFGLKLRLVPIVGGNVNFESIILPAATLAIVMASKFTRQVRATILEQLNEDYVVGARARGMSERYILWREVLPNALLPLITLVGLSLGNLLGGTAVVEIVFGWPGLGRLAVDSIMYRDFFTIQGIVLWIALMYMIINMIIDALYLILDPRLKKGGI